MKKKAFLLILPSLFSFGCDKTGNLAKQKYYFGIDASALKSELTKKRKRMRNR